MADTLRILVTGGKGQLAQCLRKQQPEAYAVTYAPRAALNLEDHASTRAQITGMKPDVVINAAAYTRVDQAEKEPEAAFAANELAVKNLAEVCRDTGALLLHISTDFLFHGAFNRPIDEQQAPAPIGIYAQSKLAGEKAVLASGVSGAIVRTSWLYSEFGNNFMKTMIRLAGEKPRLTVIADQHGSPTYAGDLAAALWQMTEKLAERKLARCQTWHFSNYGVTTWYDFAVNILVLAGSKTPVEPILTAEYPVPTPRPAYSALWPRGFSQEFDFPIRNWRLALADAVAAYNKQQDGAFL
ncbi:MAG TPA: dTDP-4-dehydrorhamnose reductase [Turneriella sp.]|nr:dTDP-4-dehydrorhamnose reductase [Turneriella sp.]HMY10183.1 dTDP-4-dehydrorhamnose reductase [Turneriella sp.]HNA79176.1 dTDP-4-dehydrorhamnose reductase [Turneriella sp.]HNE19914.1 dTDP-4-dehydrorhamnose reductase [Turneriella sp.]HNJ66209.1 dTDP-4-dehydrorhamnose reductase [Turneriella sp.]